MQGITYYSDWVLCSLAVND